MNRRAHAKINLTLRVGAPEPVGTPHPGWHRIVSWMVPIELHDDVTVRRGSGHEIEWATDAPRPTPIDWPIEHDLAVRAIAALEKHVGRKLGLSVLVSKRIPVGGGLGGGSSDAAAALIAANQLLGLGLDARTLREISANLGSDVAYFIDDDLREVPRGAIVADFGTVRSRVMTPRGEMLLVVPPFGCETRAVYRAFDGTPAGKRRLDVNECAAAMTLQAESTAALRDALRGENDLFAAACVVQPKIKALARELSEIVTRIAPEAHVQMTGSGSTLIVGGVDRSHRAAITAACGQNAACRGCVVVPTKTCA